MATMNVSLPDPMAVAELQRLVTEGVESGPPEAFDLEAFLADKLGADKLGDRAAKTG